ncbi:hypothetical protein ACUTR7_17000 [Delftia sp. NA_296.1]|uniref:hypothetical protein n=1 Tax=Delftia sp. NA_296.1 TaxID=3415648 RepID=UPI0040461F32
MKHIDFADRYKSLRTPPPRSKAPTIALLATLGFLLARSCASCMEVHRRRSAGRTVDKPRNIQRRDGEGGSHEPPVGGSIME